MNQHLKQAIAAARAGKQPQAKVLLARVLKEEPENVNAWFLLSSLADTEEQKIHYLEKVLEFKPDHAAARQQLSELAPLSIEMEEEPWPAAESEVPEPGFVERYDEPPAGISLDFEEAQSQGDAPDDPDEAMAWLERLAAGQGAPLNELPTMTAAPVSAEPEIEVPEAASPAMDVPDDPDEAMAWLERLAADQGAPLNELPTMTAAPVSAEPEIEIPQAALPEEADPAEDIPDDPDEAMAWLEQLAANQGAPLDELPTITDRAESVDEPEEGLDWLEQLAADDDSYLESLPTLVDEPFMDLTDESFEDSDAAYLEELLRDDEETAKPEKTVAVSHDSYDFVAQAEGDSIPSWLAGEEDYISAETIISKSPAEESQPVLEPENLPDWLQDKPAEEWLEKEQARTGQVMWKAGDPMDAGPKPELREKKVTQKSATRKAARTGADTTLLIYVLIFLAVLLVLAILYVAVVQPL
jgi:hypothetical protein